MPVEERWAYVYTVHDGKVSRVELWNGRDAREAALEAWAGLMTYSIVSTSSRILHLAR